MVRVNIYFFRFLAAAAAAAAAIVLATLCAIKCGTALLAASSVPRIAVFAALVNDLHHYDDGISYTEAKFIKDKWAEWTTKQSSYIPSNIYNGVETVHVVDNID